MGSIQTTFKGWADKFGEFFKPLWDKVIGFLDNDLYVLYAAIGIILAIVVVAGIIACFKKIPKTFITLIVLLGIVVGLWYFLGR